MTCSVFWLILVVLVLPARDRELFERLEIFYLGAYERGSQGYDEHLLGAEERIASLTEALRTISREDPGGYFGTIAVKALGNTT